MSSKGKSSPAKSSPKKSTPKKSVKGGVAKPKVVRSGTMTKTAASADRFLKKTKFEDKTTPMALRGARTKMGDIESINKKLIKSTRRLSGMERTALEGSAFALRAERRAKTK